MNNNSTIVKVKSNTSGNRLYDSVNVTISDDSQELFVQEIFPGNQFQIYPIVTQSSADISLQKIIIQAKEPIENVDAYVKLEGPNSVNVMVTKKTKEQKWELQFVPPARFGRDEPTTVNVHLGEDEGENFKNMHVVAGACAGLSLGVVAGAFLSSISMTLVGGVAAVSLSLAGYLWRKANKM